MSSGKGLRPALQELAHRPAATITRREALKRILFYSAAASQLGTLLSACDPPPVPPIGWHPSVLRPVFYGHQDFDAPTAPGPLRIFYPSTDGSPQDAPFLEGTNRYPLVLFLHGHCADADQYKHWFLLPAQLARSAFVVVVPRLPSIVSGTHPQTEPYPDLALIGQVLEWVRTNWVHAARVQAARRTAVVGHSYGALLGGRVVTEAGADFRAYVSLSGVWQDWTPPPPRPLGNLSLPTLLTWGSIDDTAEINAVLEGSNAPLFDSVPRPKHRVVFAEGHHWDYLPANQTTCESSTGPCDLVDNLAADLVAVFLSKYLAPPGFAGSTIDDDFTLPEVELTQDQQFFIGGHLTGLRAIENRPEGCAATISWFTSAEGSRNLPA